MAKDQAESQARLSIGDVADATGIAPDTIRVWERRYGRPEPVRLPSGHRRYTPEQVRWLRRVAEALARGHRPGKIVRASERELDRILETRNGEAKSIKKIEPLLALVDSYDRDGLERRLKKSCDQLDVLPFLKEIVGPLVIEVGRRWADGKMEVRHEHFLSELLEDVLRSVRLSLQVRQRRGPIVLATLPGESHGIGLQMAALTCAACGVRTRTLGTQTPLEEIVRAVEETGAEAVAISVSLATGGVETDRQLADLRRMVPDEIRIVIGGGGARGVRRGPRGVEYVDGLDGYADWLKTL